MPRTWSDSTSATPSAVQTNYGVQKATSVPAAATPGLLAAKSAARPGPTINPAHTRDQLPRTPLGSAHGNANKRSSSRSSDSRTRSAFPPTKIPRPSHVARSASPSRRPGGLSTPEARASGSHGVLQDGRSSIEKAASMPEVSGMSTPVDTKRIEEEMLAAFARTPKVPRSPPVGGARLQAFVAGESTPVDTKTAEEEMLAAFARTPKVVRTPPGGGARLHIYGADAAEVSAAAKEASSTATENAPRPEQRGAGKEAPTGDPEARTVSTTGIKEMPAAGLSNLKTATATTSRKPQVELTEQEHLVATAPPRVVEPPVEQLVVRSAKLARTVPKSGGADESAASSTAECELRVPPVARQQKGLDVNYDAPETSTYSTLGSSTLGAGGGPGTSTAAVKGRGRMDLPAGRGEPQQKQHLLLPSAARAAARERSVEPAFAGSPWRYASPSAVSVESGSGFANVRSMAGSVARGFGGTLTPAAFKGLASGMRTPGMKRADSLVDEVRGQSSRVSCWCAIFLCLSHCTVVVLPFCR